MDLNEKENKTLHIIREASNQFKNIAILWSCGKDSTALLHLVRKAFFGKVPFPVIHIDTGVKFPEMYEFRDRVAKEWSLNLIIARNEEAMKEGVSYEKGRMDCCTRLKTDALKSVMDRENFDALLLAIRRDEHGIRAKERVFSPRDQKFQWDYNNQPPEMWDLFRGVFEEGKHVRVHPILDWTETDVWEFMKNENIPVNKLYFAKEGKRYRSLGCMPCTKPVDSDADYIDKIIKELSTTNVSERSGRDQDKEKAFMMQKLRALGYM